MAIIHSQGLFAGERLSLCSDVAQLHWPRLFVASNTFGRLELNHKRITESAYANFRVKPTEVELAGWVQEYADNFLLFIYEAPEGSLWGQWLTPKELLSRYQTAEDRRSPAPDAQALEAFRQEYVASKKRKHIKINNLFKPHKTTSNRSEPLGTVPNHTEPQQTTLNHALGIGIGIGKGIGIGDGKNPSDSPKGSSAGNNAKPAKSDSDSRHMELKGAIEKYWQFKNPNIPKMPWDGKEAGKLGALLKSCPEMTLDQFQACLNNRGKSPVNHGRRPYLWLEQVTDFANGPLDEFLKPINGEKTNGNNGKPTGAIARIERNRDAIRQVAAKYRHGSGFNADGSDAGQLPEPGASAGDCGDVVPAMA